MLAFKQAETLTAAVVFPQRDLRVASQTFMFLSLNFNETQSVFNTYDYPLDVSHRN